MKKTTLSGLTLAILMASSPAFALNEGELRMNGFGTAGMTRIGGADEAKGYGSQGQTTDSWRGDQMSKLGGQIQYGIDDKLDITAQIVAKAEQDKWKLDVEWLYLTYNLNDETAVRAGRLRPGTFLFSETLDVGYSYPWLSLPEEVYGLVHLTNYEGADVMHGIATPFGKLNLQGSFGEAKKREQYIPQIDDMVDIDYKNLIVAAASLDTDNLGTLRYSYNEADLSLNGGKPLKGKFMSLGHRFDNGTWVTNAEVVNRRIETTNANDAFYLMAGHRFGDIMPHVTYAQRNEHSAGKQSSWTYGVNYALNANVTLKGEYKRVETKGDFDGAFVTNYSTFEPTFDGEIVSVGANFVF